jgi:hypothetical protein
MAGNEVTVPNDFVANTKARSAEVDANFQALVDAMTDGTKDMTIGTTFTKTSAKSANYVVSDTDSIRTLLMTTGTNTFDFVDGDISSNIITENGHGMDDGTVVYETNSGGALPTELIERVPHYVVSSTANTFRLSLTIGGSALTLTTGGGGTHTLHEGVTVTLPTLSANQGRVLTIAKVDSGVTLLAIDGEGAETTDGVATILIYNQYDSITLQAGASGWHSIGGRSILWQSQTLTESDGGDVGTDNTDFLEYTGLTVGRTYKYSGTILLSKHSSDSAFDILIREGTTDKRVLQTLLSGSILNTSFSFEYKFIAGETSVKLRTSGLAAGSSLIDAEKSSVTASWADIEDLSNHVLTDQLA